MTTDRAYIRQHNSTLYKYAVAVAKENDWDNDNWKRLANTIAYLQLTEPVDFGYDYYEEKAALNAYKGIYKHFIENDAEELADDDRGGEDEGYFYNFSDADGNYIDLFNVLKKWRPTLAAGVLYQAGRGSLESTINHSIVILQLIPFIEKNYEDSKLLYTTLVKYSDFSRKLLKKPTSNTDLIKNLKFLRNRLDDTKLPVSIHAKYALVLLHDNDYKSDSAVYDALFVYTSPRYSEIEKFDDIDIKMLTNSAAHYGRYDVVWKVYKEERITDTELIDIILNNYSRNHSNGHALYHLINNISDKTLANLYHRSALSGNYKFFKALIKIKNDINNDDWKYMLQDAVSGGNYKIVKLVMNDLRTNPEEELGMHHELYYMAMNNENHGPGLIATLLSDKEKYPPRDAIFYAEKMKSSSNKVAIIALLKCENLKL